MLFVQLVVVMLVLCATVSDGFITSSSSSSFVGRRMRKPSYLSDTKPDQSPNNNENTNIFAKVVPPAPSQATTPATTPSTTTPTIASSTIATTAIAATPTGGEQVVDLDSLGQKSEFKTFQPKVNISEMYVKTGRKAPRQAGWFPLLLSPTVLDGSLAGDVGFDPFGFAGQSKESLNYMREAEVKHSRLAMLAAAGWPLSELWHRQIATALGLESILASEDKAPSVLNGGLVNQWIIGAGVAALIIGALLEFRTFQSQKAEGYKPGALGFDPLNFYAARSKFGLEVVTEKLTEEEKLARARFEMELAEIKHGRLAMLAITADALQEFISGIPVVEQTPFFFGDPIQ